MHSSDAAVVDIDATFDNAFHNTYQIKKYVSI